MKRIVVSHSCAEPCRSCVACRPGTPAPSLAAVREAAGSPELILGGGDATRWSPLLPFLDENRARPAPQKVWIEAPARAFTEDVLDRLVAAGAHGVVVQIEAAGDGSNAPGDGSGAPGDGERAIAQAEARGLAAQARLCARPDELASLARLARRIAPRLAWLELVPPARGGPAFDPATVEGALLASPNLHFSSQRQRERGYLPPCLMPELWVERPEAWAATLTRASSPRRALPACGECALALRCQWSDAPALDAVAVRAARPVTDADPKERKRSAAAARPPGLDGAVLCTAPWTTMEVVDPDGRVFQCCADWTVGDRGLLPAGTLASVWNAEGYQAARRIMAGGSLGRLCQPVCPRLYDRKFSSERFEIHDGAEPYVKNQLLMAEEIATRREVVRSRPLYLALCPSTYCNYDCIMCEYGRTPRRDLPESIWDELFEFLPTLRALTLLGGEPLANPLAMGFLRRFQRDRYPDASVSVVTNGSLLGESALQHLRNCHFGSVTVSLNAGTPEVYERVQRGISLADVLKNVDAIVRFSGEQRRPFPVTLSFVVQPANIATLIDFGEIARTRGVGIRLLPLSPHSPDGLGRFYDDEDQVGRVVAELGRFAEYAARLRPDWLPEIHGAREAVTQESAARRAGPAPGQKHLPLVHP